MEAVVGTAAHYDSQTGLFTPGTPMANDAGMEMLSGKHEIGALKKELEAAGYKGERVVYLSVNDVPRINAIAEVGVDMLRKLGMNIDEIATDWGTVVQRSVNRKPLDQGGWSVFCAFSGGYDCATPGSHQLMRCNGDKAYNGWPVSAEMESLRDQWLAADGLSAQQELARKLQIQAWQDVPYLPVGSYYQPTAYKADLTDMLKSLILFTNVRRT
jgi:peptide/nickel transport system substrate-binding protein